MEFLCFIFIIFVLIYFLCPYILIFICPPIPNLGIAFSIILGIILIGCFNWWGLILYLLLCLVFNQKNN